MAGGQPRIVCLHGLGRDPSDWNGVTEALSALGDVSTPALPRRFDQAVRAADRAIEPGALVVGHSMGGVAALQLAVSTRRPLAGLLLSNCAFPPRRNGRPTAATLADYGRHRIAFARDLRAGGRAPRPRGDTGMALASFARLALRRSLFAAEVIAPVLVVHTRDDHHVPVDFAVAAARDQPDWDLQGLDRGGHHLHVTAPGEWAAAALPWMGVRFRP
jgi:pimeloyl-ACP methyl ester carboxylesterase